MLTVDKGQSEMKPVQETTPEQKLTWTAEELDEFEQLPLLENADLINISMMTAWDNEDLGQQPDNKLRIVMMDCGDGLGDLVSTTEYSTLDQF
jgi:hypothetical protein